MAMRGEERDDGERREREAWERRARARREAERREADWEEHAEANARRRDRADERTWHQPPRRSWRSYEHDDDRHGANAQYPMTTQHDMKRSPAAHNVDRISSGMAPERSGLDHDPEMYVDKPGPGFWHASYRQDQLFSHAGAFYSPLDRETLNAYDRQVQPTDAARAYGFHEPEPDRGQSHRGRGPRNYRRIDQRVFEDVCDALTHDPDVDASDIEVQVENGVVRLTGTVRSREQKRRAEIATDNIPGVDDVMNELRIVR